jgi:hypothetical protein
LRLHFCSGCDFDFDIAMSYLVRLCIVYDRIPIHNNCSLHDYDDRSMSTLYMMLLHIG